MVKPRRVASFYSKAASAFFLGAPLLLLGLSPSTVDASCPTCAYVDDLLKPCNTKLAILTWPGHMIYQPTDAQAPCACNQNYYDLIKNCLGCETSDTANYTVAALDFYKSVCSSQNQVWKDINNPNGTVTTTTAPSSTTASSTTITTSPSGLTGSTNGSSSSLSSGAIAGIVVSVIALIVALSVAAYVYSRRRREHVAADDDLDEYKYNTNSRDSYMDGSLPQYTGQIQPVLPPISKISNLRVMNPDSDDEASGAVPTRPPQHQASFEVNRTSSPGWRRGSFDDD
ncbi:hypothetical protein BG015_002134 [Linnemannia schmuckeri]|uniref:Uncharacterized protein n=1 Tax=Linnemannia schmuckeri TaxID=64567 RepID=A0A9P5V6I5_9FUNG|nr:hypothetical protein BG015_002134 [Linnemannia schmuckeri]